MLHLVDQRNEKYHDVPRSSKANSFVEIFENAAHGPYHQVIVVFTPQARQGYAAAPPHIKVGKEAEKV